jgi:hypothetical protein
MTGKPTSPVPCSATCVQAGSVGAPPGYDVTITLADSVLRVRHQDLGACISACAAARQATAAAQQHQGGGGGALSAALAWATSAPAAIPTVSQVYISYSIDARSIHLQGFIHHVSDQVATSASAKGRSAWGV